MSNPATITLPDAIKGDYWPPSSDLNGKIVFGPIQFQNPDTLALSDPTTQLNRVVATFKNPRFISKFILDSDDNQNRNGPIYITQDVGAWTFEIRHMCNFLPEVGDWNCDIAIYHGNSNCSLTIYKSTVTVNPEV